MNLRADSFPNRINISWDEVEYADLYEVEADGNSCTVAQTVYTHSALFPNTTHTYRIKAANEYGTSEWSSVLSVMTKLETPVNLTAVTEGNSVALSWDPVPDATGYIVYRNGEVEDTVTTNIYTDSDLQVGNFYRYAVKAYSDNNESLQSESVGVSIGLEDLVVNSDLTLTENKACVNLNLRAGTLNLAGHTLIVEGNLLQTGGTMNINGGRLEVEGDYKIQSSDGSYCDGILNMTNESDYVCTEAFK